MSGKVFFSFVVLYCIVAARAVPKTRSLVARALDSASSRVSRKDSMCHGAHHEKNLTDQVYMSFVRRRAMDQEKVDDHSLRTLHEWCRSDNECCAAYYLDRCGEKLDSSAAATELEMFRYLTSSWHDRDFPLTQLLDESGICGGGSTSALANITGQQILDNVLRKAWILEMRLQTCTRGKVQCADNQKFIYSPTEFEGRCVCAAHDDDCHTVYRRQHTTPWTYSVTAIVVSSVALFLFSILEIYKICVQIPIFRALCAQLRKSGSLSSIENVRTEFIRTVQSESRIH